LNTIINVTSGLAFVQLSKVPVCATKRFPFIYNFNETLAKKKKKIEVIEMIPALNTDLGKAYTMANQKSVIL
jgi:uncharacterized oxidoreductase